MKDRFPSCLVLLFCDNKGSLGKAVGCLAHEKFKGASTCAVKVKDVEPRKIRRSRVPNHRARVVRWQGNRVLWTCCFALRGEEGREDGGDWHPCTSGLRALREDCVMLESEQSGCNLAHYFKARDAKHHAHLECLLDERSSFFGAHLLKKIDEANGRKGEVVVAQEESP